MKHGTDFLVLHQRDSEAGAIYFFPSSQLLLDGWLRASIVITRDLKYGHWLIPRNGVFQGKKWINGFMRPNGPLWSLCHIERPTTGSHQGQRECCYTWRNHESLICHTLVLAALPTVV